MVAAALLPRQTIAEASTPKFIAQIFAVTSSREFIRIMNPEEKAREEIDRQLAACGWLVQDHKAMNIMAGPGVAVREFALKSGFADYLLYAGNKVIGVIEAKPEGHTL